MLNHVDRFIALSVTAEGWKCWCPPSGESRSPTPGAFLELRTVLPSAGRQHCPRMCQARRQQAAFQRTLAAAWAVGAGAIPHGVQGCAGRSQGPSTASSCWGCCCGPELQAARDSEEARLLLGVCPLYLLRGVSCPCLFFSLIHF